jgi:ABC-type Fe3+-siderophore transport system permease subunit
MKGGRFTLIEFLIALATLSIIGTFALRIIYGRQLHEWEQSLGPGRYFVTVPIFLFLLYLYWQRSAKEARALGQPVVRTWVWVTAALGIVAACAVTLAA